MITAFGVHPRFEVVREDGSPVTEVPDGVELSIRRAATRNGELWVTLVAPALEGQAATETEPTP